MNTISVTLDSGATITDFNNGAEILTGYKKNEIIGKNWFEIFIPDEILLDVLKAFTDIFNGNNEYWVYTNSIKCKNNKFKKFKWTNTLIKDENGKTTELNSVGIEVFG